MPGFPDCTSGGLAGFTARIILCGDNSCSESMNAEAAREMGQRSAREEGMLAAIAQKLPDLPAGATVLGFNHDTGESYLSVEGFLPSEARRAETGHISGRPATMRIPPRALAC